MDVVGVVNQKTAFDDAGKVCRTTNDYGGCERTAFACYLKQPLVSAWLQKNDVSGPGSVESGIQRRGIGYGNLVSLGDHGWNGPGAQVYRLLHRSLYAVGIDCRHSHCVIGVGLQSRNHARIGSPVVFVSEHIQGLLKSCLTGAPVMNLHATVAVIVSGIDRQHDTQGVCRRTIGLQGTERQGIGGECICRKD